MIRKQSNRKHQRLEEHRGKNSAALSVKCLYLFIKAVPPKTPTVFLIHPRVSNMYPYTEDSQVPNRRIRTQFPPLDLTSLPECLAGMS